MRLKGLVFPVAFSLSLWGTTSVPAQVIDFKRGSRLLCEVTTIGSGTLPDLWMNQGKATFSVLYITSDYRLNRSKRFGAKGLFLIKVKFPGSDEVDLYNDEDCSHRGLWYCKSSAFYRADTNTIVADLFGFDAGQNISGYLEAVYDFTLNLSTGKVKTLSQTQSRLLRVLPPIRREGEGYCRHAD